MPSNDELRVLVADDHEVVRKGVRALLESRPGWKVCAEAVDGREAVEKAKALQPHVAILDLGMPVLNGLEALGQIRKVAPDTEVLILSMHESEQLAQDVLATGARGYLMKSDAGRELVRAVETVSRHKPYFTSQIAERMLRSYLEPDPARDGPAMKTRLTPREREIIRLLAEGRTNREVARHLRITTKTAETHRARIMQKLRLNGLADLIRYAIRNQITQS